MDLIGCRLVEIGLKVVDNQYLTRLSFLSEDGREELLDCYSDTTLNLLPCLPCLNAKVFNMRSIHTDCNSHIEISFANRCVLSVSGARLVTKKRSNGVGQ